MRAEVGCDASDMELRVRKWSTQVLDLSLLLGVVEMSLVCYMILYENDETIITKMNTK